MKNIIHLSFKTNEYQVRRETWMGQKQIVVPTVLLVEGVHAGSGGPTFYPLEELQKFPQAWNGIPVTLNHPVSTDNIPLSANSPEVLEGWQLGRVWNVNISDGKLKGEVWLEESRLQEFAPEVLSILLAGADLEVSTGLFADGDSKAGVWNETEYFETVYNYRPDHFALLPGGEGACSFNDGCGIRANKKFDAKNIQNAYIRSLKKDFQINKLSHEEIREELRQLVRDKHPADGNYIWVQDVYDKKFIYELETSAGIKLHEQGYSKKKDIVSLEGVSQEVERKVSYVKVNATKIKLKEENMCCEEKVQELIDNQYTVYADEDADWLKELEEAHIDKMLANAEGLGKKEPAPEIPDGAVAIIDDRDHIFQNGKWELKPVEDITDNESVDEKVPTVSEYISSAPEEIQEMLQNGLDMYAGEKEFLITSLVENEACLFSKEDLESKPVKELQMLNALAKTEQTSPEAPTRNYSRPISTIPVAEKEEAMEPPVINWG